MRNYIKAFSCNVTADATSPMTYFGTTAAQALAIANAVKTQLVAGGFTHVQVIENPPIYILLNRSFVLSVLINEQNGSQPSQGQLANAQFQNFQSISTQLGLDPFVSPKLQKKKPWNGR